MRIESLVEDILVAVIEEDGGKIPDIVEAVEAVQSVDGRLRRLKKKPLTDIVQTVLIKLDKDNQLNQAVVGLWKKSDKKEDEKSDTKDEEKDVKSVKKRKTVSKTNQGNSKPNSQPEAEEKDKSEENNVHLTDLGGVDQIIDEVLELIALPLAHPEVFTTLGSDIPRGVLLHGPPGCGKTLLAHAIANEIGCAFVSVSAPSIVSGMSGESEKKLRSLFDDAKQLAPCLVFIDEIDAITPKRETAQREMERRIVAQLLTCMDDVALSKTGGKPVMVIGATNRPDSIDPALRRGGRFDHEVCMPVPDQNAREKILATLARNLRIDGNCSFVELAKRTPGYVGADLNALVSAAGTAAIKRIFQTLSEPDMMLDDSVPAPLKAISDISGANDNSHDNANDKISVVRSFLARYPEPLTETDLEGLSIIFDDFLTALKQVQPSSKREGFATVPDVTWKDVGAMAKVREELEYAVVQPIQSPEIYLQAGISAPSGVLLWGPPGCGKTLLAKAVANESKANFISVRGPELLNKYVGESERAVRQVFVRARASTPCIIFFDELDALVPKRDDAQSEASSRVVNTLLTELDGTSDRSGVYVVAATNRPDMIDSAMLRPGRLDKQLFVELPDSRDRAEILRAVCLKNKSPLSADIDLELIARDTKCRNFSGADLASLIREASVFALRRALRTKSPVQVSLADFKVALDKVRPSVSDTDREKYIALQQTWGA